MAFDFKKEFKEFYLPAVRGKSNPNEEGGAAWYLVSLAMKNVNL